MNTITLRFPLKAKIAVIEGQWYRDSDDSIVATYTMEELELCMGALEASEQCRLSRQKKGDVISRAMEKFGAKAPEAF